MAYPVAADFRTATIAEYAHDIPLSTTEVSNANTEALLGATIARMVERFEELTNDRFISETLTLDIDGSGHRKLVLPKRCTGITTLSLRQDSGSYVAQSASNTYQLHSSLYASGAKRIGDVDWVEVLPHGDGLVSLPTGGHPFYWPRGQYAVRIAGTWGWTTTPADVKRAIALLVYDHYKPIRDDLRRAEGYRTQDADIRLVPVDGTSTGLPEVDRIVAEYRREDYIGVR